MTLVSDGVKERPPMAFAAHVARWSIGTVPVKEQSLIRPATSQETRLLLQVTNEPTWPMHPFSLYH
jgi:hypothetical protein